MINVLFVCLGNICRSPMAEGIFKKIVADANLETEISCDSAGIIGYHAGEPADSRMRQTAKSHGIILTNRSRQLTIKDLSNFDYILGMDKNNMKGISEIVERNPKTDVIILKMREFDADKSGKDVEDPYYQEDIGFELCYNVLLESGQNFLNYLIEKHQLTKVDM